MKLKFRAWDKEFKMMYDVDGIDFFGEIIEVDNEYDHQTDKISKYEVMQYTGVTDKNGKEIFEGDIVKLTVPDRHYTMQGDGYSDIMREDGFEFVGEVKFLHAMWFIKESLDGYPLIFDTNQTLEVIGNIYEGTGEIHK